MCACDWHIYYVSLLFLDSKDLQNHLIEATSPSNLVVVIYFFVVVIYFFVLVIYFFVLVILYSNAAAYI